MRKMWAEDCPGDLRAILRRTCALARVPRIWRVYTEASAAQ